MESSKIQQVTSAISGYEYNKSFTSAKCDYYYDECKTLREKYDHVQNYAENVLNFTLNAYEMMRAILFLETEGKMDQNERFFSFQDLQ